MPSLMHLFDFHGNNSARKVFWQKNRDGGHDAPRNSFELQVQNFQKCREMKDTQLSYGFEQEWCERRMELFKRSNQKQNAPSIVAKLMGFDAPPLELKLAAMMNLSVEDEKGRRSRKGKRTVAISEEMETESLYCDRFDKPNPREHPQEEELQRFKKEFLVWQAARFEECSRVVDSDHTYGNCKKQREYGLMDDLRCDSDQKDRLFRRTRSFGREFNLKSDWSPTKIVVLKPGPYRFNDCEGWSITSPSTTGGSRGRIEEFLEEVKDRLGSEIQGRPLERNMKKRVCVGRRLKETREILKAGGREDMKRRVIGVEDRVSGEKDSSPRNLIRSLSAPVSGKSFGKLLLEDGHVLTGAQIRRKHEAAEQESANGLIRRKTRFNFRQKVSNFRSSLGGRRIFGKKIRSKMESNSFEDEYIKDLLTGSRFTSFHNRNENSTEVPPSPASVFSSNPEEFWRNIDDLSPASTPDIFRDIGSNLNEENRQIKELEYTPVEREANHEPEFVEFTNMDKAFVRDLLVASGLYHGTSDKEPMNKSVFQETEENHRERRTKQNSEDRAMEAEAETDHYILFDLLNEALAVVLGSQETKPCLRRRDMNSSGLIPLRGKHLLEETWQIMSECLYVQTDKPFFCSLDGIMAWDLGSSSWNGLIDDEVKVLGREVEDLIMADLVEDLL
ncbi:PREDICTED: uncharacterized protein LOC104819718 [Tarenaya hassleriana]|uniref:uncharacterized protein LOC104819718 n=1 Tax=Tarenaya hassleriana TaxID=28532 RepID=UPI00053C59FF|nr:PREDICTED: uncharacterized protein LOC104819718 [Tarenaya hassleriana]XP_010548210.1 PREDICTED: uncharacterized protein LOC104819718 [Tarenaya hassleriana]XP_019058698.1 PREDICTED: uncharacterized protein LOC104819718 [Tarenaya hassleriana]